LHRLGTCATSFEPCAPTIAAVETRPPVFPLLVWGLSGRKWEPWPVEPPFVDRVEIHWPGDDWPPVPPPCVVEDRLPDTPPQIIAWRDTGGLLDMWA